MVHFVFVGHVINYVALLATFKWFHLTTTNGIPLVITYSFVIIFRILAS
jgi:hypothetical protein